MVSPSRPSTVLIALAALTCLFALDRERDSFPRHRGEGFFWNGDFAACPGVAREPPDEEAKRSLLSRFVGEADNDHAMKLTE